MTLGEGGPHRPHPGRPVPASTYRLQLHAGFGFAAAAELVPYLHRLGVTHAYLSPVLAAGVGSMHGYDVVDHGRISAELGGRDGLSHLVRTLRAHQMGAVVDVVPNHMAVPTPAWHNAALWSVLRDGPASAYASWFDVDWRVDHGALLMPVLGSRIGQVLDAGELVLARDGGAGRDEPVLRYFDHEFPVRPGTTELPLAQMVDQQWYRLAHWRVGDQEVNYRRFFDIDTLAALRQEEPTVFEETHALLVDLVRSGEVDGLRIDHPDGLADPRDYLDQLAERTDGAWVVVEKILEPDEALPSDWSCSGTTGYDTLRLVSGVFHDGAGAQALTALAEEVAAETEDWPTCTETAKREVVEGNQYAEVHRLVDLLVDICADDVALRDHTRRDLLDSVVELLVAFPRYRAYVHAGESAPAEAVSVVTSAADRARTRLADDQHDALALVRDLVLGVPVGVVDQPTTAAVARRAAFVTRFQQTCGPVMAKGAEDTAAYRWVRLLSLNEVGGDPAHVGVAPGELHAYAAALLASHPTGMTTLSTHDTKRSEDVRARLAVASELPAEWTETVRALRSAAAAYRPAELDGRLELLVWQTLVGTWPITPERLHPYVEKAMREAKTRTSWTAPDAAYESDVHDFLDRALADTGIRSLLEGWTADTRAAVTANVLGQKLLQLVLPGVPDVYQGCEAVALSLVDPDNRRPVDYDALSRRLETFDEGTAASADDLDQAKLVVTAQTLRLRREHPEWFVGPDSSYEPVATSSASALAVARGDARGPQVVAVVTRLSVSLARFGGWGSHTLTLPAGPRGWVDLLTGRELAEGTVAVGDLLADLPVALLRRR